VRRDPKTRDIPIIFISATFMSPEDRDFALSLGAVRFLEKPIESEELLLTVAEVLTDAPRQPASSLSDPEFYRGYSRRLEAKLREKHSQVVRARRLVDSVDDQQRSTFVRLLAQTEAQRDEIERELKALRDLLDDEA
jgi:response regulator RpfG family c-di-GMP phosphodiesterase